MSIRLPSVPRQWRQTNISDIASNTPYAGDFGDLWATFNIDTDEVAGKLRLGKRLLINTSTADVSQLTGVPVGFRFLANKIITAAGAGGTGYVFKTGTNSLTSNFSRVTGGGAPTTVDSLQSDIEILNGQAFVTLITKQASYSSDGTNWTTLNVDGGGSDATYAHMMAAYANRMYMSMSGNKICSWDNSATPVVATMGAQYTITLPFDNTSQIITFIRSAANRLWIGTVNVSGGKGYVYTWDGSSAQTTTGYRLDSPGALSCLIKDDVPYIIDVYGKLLKWNGGTFIVLSQFNMENNRTLFYPLALNNNRFIHPNGMSLIYGNIHILIDGRNYDGGYGPPDTFSQLQQIPSGIYEYDDQSSISHKHSFTLGKSSDTITEYGQNHLNSTTTTSAVGALSEFLLAPGGSSQNGSFLCGGTYLQDQSSATPGFAIYYDDLNDTKQKAGYIITAKVYSPNVIEVWQKIYIRFRQLLNSTDKIVLKYRVIENLQSTGNSFLEVSDAVVISQKQFTTSGSISGFAIGDEVEFTAGLNSGICSHITAISSGPPYTVTVDENLTSGTASSRARFSQWVKLQSSITDQSSSWREYAIGQKSLWVQFKVWMLWTGKNSVEELVISNKGDVVPNL